MRGFLYCFSIQSLCKDSKQNFQNIYKISTTVRNVKDILQENNYHRYLNKGLFSLEFAVEFENINSLEIFEKLYIYKIHNEENFYKTDLSIIKKLLNEDIKSVELRKRKLSVIKRFLKSTIQKTSNFGYNKVFLYYGKNHIYNNDEIQTLKVSDLYEAYTQWCKLNNIKEKAEICEFFDLCVSHTFLGITNEDYEWEFVSLKHMNSHSCV